MGWSFPPEGGPSMTEIAEEAEIDEYQYSLETSAKTVYSAISPFVNRTVVDFTL
jgi:hypothetical protein